MVVPELRVHHLLLLQEALPVRVEAALVAQRWHKLLLLCQRLEGVGALPKLFLRAEVRTRQLTQQF